MQQSLVDFISDYSEWLYWLALSSVVLLLASILIMPVIIARMPADYFHSTQRKYKSQPFSAYKFVLRLIKNLIGISLLIFGIIMLFTPGQGILTILAGLFITNFPGKYKLERKLIQNPSILRALNWIRKKYHAPEFKI